MIKQPSTYTQIVTPFAQQPETTDDLIKRNSPTSDGIVTGFAVEHDGSNNPTVELFDGTVASGVSIFKRTYSGSVMENFPEGGVKVKKLSAKTSIGAGTVTIIVFYRK